MIHKKFLLVVSVLDTPTDTLTTSQQAEIDQLQEQQTAARLIDKLPAERQEQAKQLAVKIDANDAQSVISYGSAAQAKLSEFSQSMLNHVQAQDIGPVGDSLTELMYRLQEANPDELRAGEGNMFDLTEDTLEDISFSGTQFIRVGFLETVHQFSQRISDWANILSLYVIQH